MTLHICTGGTSIMTPFEAITPKTHLSADGKRDAERFQREIGNKLEALKAQHGDRWPVLLSAETNGLFRAGVRAGDEVVLLHSETIDGKMCAHALAKITEKNFKVRVTVRKVEGLQVHDPVRFRRVGVPRLFGALDELTREKSPDQIRLNVSGGFKGVVPFVVLYAMFHDLQTAYVFERTGAEILLPRFPIEFDWARFEPAAEALMTVYKNTALPKWEIDSLLPMERHALWTEFDVLFETYEGDSFGPSPIGFLVLSRLTSLVDMTPVSISPRAKRTLEGIPAHHGIGRIVHQMIARLRNPLTRRLPHHSDTLVGSDLRVSKRYTRAGPRVLYWVSRGTVYVAEAFTHHDDYERFISGPNLRSVENYNLEEFIQFAADHSDEPMEEGFLESLRLEEYD